GPGEPGGSVRWIEADPMIPGRMYAAIAGAGVLRTHDYGLAWDDRHRSSLDDPHTLACHQFAPGRIYAAGADGYAESRDGGDTWRRDDVGLKHPYLYALAIDPGDPETLIVSAARSRRRAHAPLIAAATVYRKSGKLAWRETRDGLPGPAAQRIYGLAANEHEPGVFYLATQRGELYRSPDAGLSWRKQELKLDARLRLGGGQPPALALSGE
ncbi:MAG TPA: hypothetical protein VGE07_19380, partial [Herpetosiphonaceae bacterium]